MIIYEIRYVFNSLKCFSRGYKSSIPIYILNYNLDLMKNDVDIMP